MCANWQFSCGWLYHVCAVVGVYLLGPCKSWPCSVFWLQFSEVGDDNYYESCDVEHQNCICMSLLYCIVPLAALISTHSCPYRSWIASTPSVQKTTIQIYLNSLFNDYLAQHTCSPPTPPHRPPRLLLRHCFASLPSTQVATVQYILLLHTSCRN